MKLKIPARRRPFAAIFVLLVAGVTMNNSRIKSIVFVITLMAAIITTIALTMESEEKDQSGHSAEVDTPGEENELVAQRDQSVNERSAPSVETSVTAQVAVSEQPPNLTPDPVASTASGLVQQRVSNDDPVESGTEDSSGSANTDDLSPLAGTRRMIAAHAPLRKGEITDPDSVENIRILQGMIQKAFARSEALSSGSTIQGD